MPPRRHQYQDVGLGFNGFVNNFGKKGFVKSIQQGTIALAGAASATATITAVNTSHSLLFHMGAISDGGAGDPNLTIDDAFLTFTNSTTITATSNAGLAATTIAFLVIEFVPGIIKSVQRGSITISGATTGTASITAVDTNRALVTKLGIKSTANSDQFLSYLALTNATTVTATRVSGGAGGTVVGYQVAEFY